jgi:hypothetical protein
MFKTHISTIKTIRQGDDDFMLNDGMIISPELVLRLVQNAPTDIKESYKKLSTWAGSNL